MGNQFKNNPSKGETGSSSGAAFITILCSDSFSIRFGSFGGVYVENLDPSSK